MKYSTTALLLLLIACGNGGDGADSNGSDSEPLGFEAPIVVNAQSPVAYPPALFDQGVGGVVTLRLFVDETGQVHTDSVMVVESSGHPALDSAAVQGVAGMQFAPARQDGRPVAATFLQPIHFSNPEHSENN